jgi:hypothetical protein
MEISNENFNLFCVFFVNIYIPPPSIIAQNECDNSLTNSQNIGIHTNGSIGLEALHIKGWDDPVMGCKDPSIMLEFATQPYNLVGHISLLCSFNINKYTEASIKDDGDMLFQAGPHAGNILLTTRKDGKGIFFCTTPDPGGPDFERMAITSDGDVGIGILQPEEKLHVLGNAWIDGDVRASGKVKIGSQRIKSSSSYYSDHALSVDGTIVTNELVVTELSEHWENWPDYVFEKDYDLLSLDELDSFIKHEKHLPGIPTAEQVRTEGLKVGDMQAKLLKKIEELTLYVIELKNENTEMKQQIDQLKKME